MTNIISKLILEHSTTKKSDLARLISSLCPKATGINASDNVQCVA